MNIRTTLIASSLIAASLVSGAAQAALVDRGGGLIYDTDLNVTWLQDANYAKTSGYDADGRMNWDQATTWAANLSYFDAVRNVTYSDWRLPTTTDTGAPGAQYSNSGTDGGYNNPATSEMSHLYYAGLSNLGSYSPTGVYQPGYGLVNKGPFTNFQANGYWSGTEYAQRTSSAWHFNTSYGYQDYDEKFYSYYALAVRPGDVAAVPEAETYALMLAGLGLVGWRARRRG